MPIFQRQKPLRGSICTLAMAFAACVHCTQGFAAHPQGAKSFFLDPAVNSQPSFTGPQLSEAELQNRRIPDIRVLRSLPNLEPEKRKQIDRLYKKWQQDTAELRNVIQSLQRQVNKMNVLATSSTVAVSVPPTGTDHSLPSSVTSSDTNSPSFITDSQNIPDKRSIVENGAPNKSLSALKNEQKELRSELLTKRKELWNEISLLLTEQDKLDLENMRRGHYIPSSITASEGK